MNALHGMRPGARAMRSRRCTPPIFVRHSSKSIETLMDRFRDPTSPFHLPPGTQGPDSPDPPAEEVSSAEEGRAKLLDMGYDPESFWEQPVVWGDHDSFQHVNNVRYVRFFETGRIHWMQALGREIGGDTKAEEMVKGKGVSLILKSLSLNYKHPVVFPDTLLVAHKPHIGHSDRSRARVPKTHFHMMGAMWSCAQRRIVTESDSVLVWYDYDKLAKCDPGEHVWNALSRRMNLAKVGQD